MHTYKTDRWTRGGTQSMWESFYVLQEKPGTAPWTSAQMLSLREDRQISKPHVSKLPTTHAAAPQIKLTTQDIPEDCSGKLLEPHCYLVSRTIQNSISEETHAVQSIVFDVHHLIGATAPEWLKIPQVWVGGPPAQESPLAHSPAWCCRKPTPCEATSVFREGPRKTLTKLLEMVNCWSTSRIN